MACLHPICVKGVMTPCGKCANCRQKIRKEMADRIMLEHKFGGGTAYFITLTYDDEHLPIYINEDTGQIMPAFSKEDTRMFTDNFRYFLTSRGLGSYRYFLTCELGEDFGRSHYHLITLHKDLKYGTPIKLIRELAEKSWSRDGTLYGRVQVVRCNINRINYATQYALKEESYLYQKYDKGDSRKPFRKFSLRPGLGAEPSALEALRKYCCPPNGEPKFKIKFSYDGGGECAVPKYIFNKFGDEWSNLRKDYNQNWLAEKQQEMYETKIANSFYDPLDHRYYNNYDIDDAIRARRKALRELRLNNFAKKDKHL